MKRTPLKRKTPLRSTGKLKRTPLAPVNRKRKAKEWERAYGSEERVRWIQYLPSVVSGQTPCENAHVKTGGTGRKADACWIVPLTTAEHRELHDCGPETFQARHEIDLIEQARLTEQAWRERQG
jgi:hypothetical protein